MDNIAWMAWTLPTAIFFCLLAGTLGVMTLLAVRYPEAERIGILRIPTTRGDRFFVSFIGAAFIFILWIRITGDGSLWVPLAGALLFAAAMFRFA